MSSGPATDIADENCEDASAQDRKRLSLLENNAFLRLLMRLSVEQYRPEKHYMRGPGPKAKARMQIAGSTDGGGQ